MLLAESVKNLINEEVYEKGASRPWAKIKDFIFSSDGKTVRTVLLSTLSLIPILYKAELNDFESICGEIVLKDGVKLKPVESRYENPKSFMKIKKMEITSGGKPYKIRDIHFNSEIGEIIDFVATRRPFGKKMYVDSSDKDFSLENVLKGE